MNVATGRRLLAEFTGTGLLVVVVAGSGIASTSFANPPCLHPDLPGSDQAGSYGTRKRG